MNDLFDATFSPCCSGTVIVGYTALSTTTKFDILSNFFLLQVSRFDLSSFALTVIDSI